MQGALTETEKPGLAPGFFYLESVLSLLVMAGLVPAIHALLSFCGIQRRGCPAQGRA